MCKLLFTSNRDVEMRLGSSIVRYEGEPIFIIEGMLEECVACKVGSKESFKVRTEDLDLEPVQIGNVQGDESYMYVQRSPTRRWKQGLDGGSIKRSRMPWRTSDWRTNHPQTLNAIIGRYASAVEAIEDVMCGRKVAVAFSQRWGVGKVEDIPHLFYKDKKVGVADEGELVLFPKYFYLKEDLLGVLNNVR